MTLKELYETKFPKVTYIGLYEVDDNGKAKTIYPDYADEMLETHGDKVVTDSYYSKNNDTLVVVLLGD